MAAALAASRLGDAVVVESAGVAPHGSRAADLAQRVVRERFGLDLSGHVPRGVAELDLATYDLIVALDRPIARELREAYHVPEERLHVWCVRDPYGGSADDYRKTATTISEFLTQLGREIAAGP